MVWAPDYCTTAQLKTFLRIGDSADDTSLGIAITAASRAIDQECNRQFGSVTPAAIRYYDYDCHGHQRRQALRIDDLMSTTSLAVAVDLADDGLYSTTLTLGTDFDLWPTNAAADGRPWTHLLMKDRSSYYLPWTEQGVKITALWGWAAVPGVVLNAALIQAGRFFMRRDAVFGAAGSPALGNESNLFDHLDSDVALMLSSVQRRWGAV